MENRQKPFHKLHIIAIVYDILTIIVIVLMVLSFLGIIITAIFTDTFGVAGAFVLPLVIINTFFWFSFALLFKSLGETIRLFLSLEEQTRTTHEHMHQLATSLAEIAENTRATALILHHLKEKKQTIE